MHKSQARPDPVSCQSCRKKKLRCTRVQPCSNCAARGITCNFLVPPQRHAETIRATTSDSELRERLDRLESLILQSKPTVTPPGVESAGNHDTNRPTSNPNTGMVVVPFAHQNLDDDSRALENVGTREDSLKHAQSSASSSEYSRLGDVVVTFPSCKVANLLFQSYENRVDNVCRIVHNPSVRALIKDFYLKACQGGPIAPGEAALLLSMFAIASFFFEPRIDSEVATTDSEAVHLSKFFSKGALDVLDHSRRTTSGTLEDVQAYILISLLIFHLDGFSARGRWMSAMAVSIARDLRMHQLDAEVSTRGTSVRLLIEREVKRRVWWYIVSSDWLLAVISGPQEGMYFIQPSHFNVRLPKNCADDDIVLDEDDDRSTTPQPTAMTYFLEKIRLAHICREVVDTVPLDTTALMNLPYEHIIALDKKMEEYLSTLPVFFKVDTESRQISKPLEIVYPRIPHLRYCLATAAYSRRCKLHQKFLLRKAQNPRYAYSRRVCLESARAVINVYEDIRNFYSPSTLMTRMGMAVHVTHLALAVMVMDLCFNRNESDIAEVKRDVNAALRVFEDARDISPLYGRFSNSLRTVLRKHNVHIANTTMAPPDHAADVVNWNDAHQDDQRVSSESTQGVRNPEVAFMDTFDEIWQSAFENEPDLNSLSWDNLFTALDTQPI